MRRMYSKSQLVKLIEEHGPEAAVSSVNGETGDVVLDATDIKLTTTQTSVQDNFIRIDEQVETNTDDIQGLWSYVGGLENHIDALETYKQDALTAGTGITIENNVISANGAATGYYIHNVIVSGYQVEDDFSINGTFQFTNQSSTPIPANGWFDLVRQLLINIGTVQFTGEVLQGGAPTTLINPVFMTAPNPARVRIYSGLTYDHNDGTFDGSGTNLYLTGNEQMSLSHDITDTIIPL